MSLRRTSALLVALVAALPYLPTLDNYFVQDDFGVVGLLSGKPAGYFPRWFATPWTDDIWGYIPDEVRPFPALTYQLAALFGPASPVANHVVNIAFHAVNALLVLGLARTAAGLASGPALFAALVFAVLPMQTESVAWITGRVDSMPACFYLASFLLYVRWRARGHASTYAWAVVACFVALFTKQTTVTLLPALVLYDLLVDRRPLRPVWAWVKPYVPFFVLTVGYLALRYVLFGHVLRESMLTEERIGLALGDLSTHFRRMVFGEPGLGIPLTSAAARVGAGVVAVVAIGLALRDHDRAVPWRQALYFTLFWTFLAAAPTIVAGYASPRHMYLASTGWALGLGFALDVLWHARPAPHVRRLGLVLAAIVLVLYGRQLHHEVRLWSVRADVSSKMVADVEREAMAAPPGTLIIAGAPRRSWEYALPHALRPPFTREDVTRRARVISDASISCCPASVWEARTRKALDDWAADPSRPPVVALHWDPDSGGMSRISDQGDPFHRELAVLLLNAKDGASLDRLMRDILTRYVADRLPAPPR